MTEQYTCPEHGDLAGMQIAYKDRQEMMELMKRLRENRCPLCGRFFEAADRAAKITRLNEVAKELDRASDPMQWADDALYRKGWKELHQLIEELE